MGGLITKAFLEIEIEKEMAHVQQSEANGRHCSRTGSFIGCHGYRLSYQTQFIALNPLLLHQYYYYYYYSAINIPILHEFIQIINKINKIIFKLLLLNY